MTSTSPREAALRYRDQWSVVPVAGKRARTEWRDYQQRRPEVEEVNGWFRDWPEAGVAIVTGPISDLAVVDIDNTEASSYRDALSAVNRLIPSTLVVPTVSTPRGGRHLYFKYPREGLRNAVHLHDLPVDVRGHAGYVVAPPSPGYEWVVPPGRDGPPAMPPGLLEFLTAPARHAVTAPDSPMSVLVTGAPEGSRNNSLHRLAWSLLSRQVDPQLALATMRAANEKLSQPLADTEVEAAWRSATKHQSGRSCRQRPTGGLPSVPADAWPQRGFARVLVDTIREHSDAPTEFALFAALTVAGAALGRGATIRYGMDLVQTNVWTVLVADSTCSRKSVVIRAATRPLAAIDPERIGAKSTPEALVDELREAPVRLFVHDELTALLSSFGRDNNGGLREDLTALYSGDVLRTRTRARGRVEVPNVHLSMLGASNTTWLQEKLKAGELRGGFAARWVAVQAQPARYEPFPPPLSEVAGDRCNAELRRLLAFSGDPRELRWSMEAKKLYGEGREALERPVGSCLPEVAAVRGRLADSALKFALIVQFDELGGGPELSPVAVVRGLALANFSLECWMNLIGVLNETSFGRDLRRVVEVLAQHGGTLSQRTLLRTLGQWKVEKLIEIGETLEARGEVERSHAERGKIHWRLVPGDTSQTGPDASGDSVDGVPAPVRGGA